MKICYYCQHILGIGHFHRSLEICRVLDRTHQVTMILGGPDVSVDEASISIHQLPGLRMDEQFSGLTPCDPLPLEVVKERRQTELLSFVRKYRPDCMIIELYPFGRKNFRFELEPLLDLLSVEDCSVFCSLRDILVEKKEGRDKFERRAVDTLNNYFSGLLIHADPDLVTLDETFGKTDEITTKIHYTGFITPKPSPGARERIRKSLRIDETKQLIVASIGSGSVGVELIEAAIMGVKKLSETRNDVILQVFTGPYLDESRYRQLCKMSNDSMRVSRFTDQFPDWLAAADLSLSMAGYNTTMNVLTTGVPALMYPFDQNREQRMRISRISSSESVALIERSDLGVEKLSRTIDIMLDKPRFSSSIMLDGAVRTAAIIEDHHRL